MSIFKFGLGDLVEDMITKFKGVITARTEWFNGCVRYIVEPQGLKDGVPIDGRPFDEQQLVLKKARVVAPNPSEPQQLHIAGSPLLALKAPRTGGPRNDMSRAAKDSMTRSRR